MVLITRSSRPHRIDTAQAYARDHGTTFTPHPEARKRLKPGYFVKLAFLSEVVQNNTDNERLWVEVTGSNGDLFTGVIRSSPAFLKDLFPGETVLFAVEHVCDISVPNQKNDTAARGA